MSAKYLAIVPAILALMPLGVAAEQYRTEQTRQISIVQDMAPQPPGGPIAVPYPNVITDGGPWPITQELRSGKVTLSDHRFDLPGQPGGGGINALQLDDTAGKDTGASWTATQGKYLTMRPRPADAVGYPDGTSNTMLLNETRLDVQPSDSTLGSNQGIGRWDVNPRALGSLNGLGSINQLATGGLAIPNDGDANRHVRHRMFAIVDRTNVSPDAGGQGGGCESACQNNLNPGGGAQAYGTGVYKPGSGQANAFPGYAGGVSVAVGDVSGSAASTVGGNKALTVGGGRTETIKAVPRK